MTEAVAEYNEALRLQPTSFIALTGLGIFEYNQNHKEEAIAFYRRAIQANEEYGAAHVALGMALVDRQQYQEGLAELQRVLEFEPRHAMLCEIHYNLGLAYRGLNMADPAIREFQTTLRFCPAHEASRQQLLEIQQILRNAGLLAPAARPPAAP